MSRRAVEGWKLEQWLTGKEAIPRTVCVYAHPDDEALAVGSRLPVVAKALFVQVTDGAPADNDDGARLGLTREQYRAERERESAQAFRAGGLPFPRRLCLGLPDKDAALHLGMLTDNVARVMKDEQAEIVLTHPYEGGHADHDACAFAVHTAARTLSSAGFAPPVIVESPFYNAGDGHFVAGRFLWYPGSGQEITLPLNAGERQRKRAALVAFATQADVLQDFSIDEERFRLAPSYDFARVPHPGPAYYERFIAGITALQFCTLANQALQTREKTACR